jgi:GNAT superfamily N-acetyltransferase
MKGIEAMTGDAFCDALVKTYLENPCQVLSNPLWKTLDKLDDFQTAFGSSGGKINRLEASNETSIFVYWRREGRQPSLLIRRKLETVPIALMHQDFLDPDVAVGFNTRQGYFRLMHDHKIFQPPQLPEGFRFAEIDTGLELLRAAAFAGQEPHVLQSWVNHPVFTPDLWLWVIDDKSGQPTALGIAELDSTYREATIEWIQVLPAHYGGTIGQNLVLELLRRLKDRADFTTVSGELDFKERENPGAFYRECGFIGQDVWWLLGRSEEG